MKYQWRRNNSLIAAVLFGLNFSMWCAAKVRAAELEKHLEAEE